MTPADGVALDDTSAASRLQDAARKHAARQAYLRWKAVLRIVVIIQACIRRRAARRATAHKRLATVMATTSAAVRMQAATRGRRVRHGSPASLVGGLADPLFYSSRAGAVQSSMQPRARVIESTGGLVAARADPQQVSSALPADDLDPWLGSLDDVQRTWLLRALSVAPFCSVFHGR